MRSRKVLSVLGLIGVMSLIIGLSGCSSDDRPTPPVPTINDQYTYVQSEVNDVVEETIALMAATLEMYESASDVTDTTVIAEIRESPFNPEEVYNSDNWYILVSDQLSTAYGERRIDSIMFTASGAPVEFAGEADGIVVRHLYDYANVNTDVTYTDYETRGYLTITGLNTTDATISGDWSGNTIAQIVDNGTEVRTYDINADINSLVVAKPVSGWGGGCPESGSIDFAISLTFNDGSDNVEISTWDVTVTFTDGTGNVTVSDGSVTTSYSQSFCTL